MGSGLLYLTGDRTSTVQVPCKSALEAQIPSYAFRHPGIKLLFILSILKAHSTVIPPRCRAKNASTVGSARSWSHLESSILLICSACKELGAEQPTYELRGNSLRVRFAALQSALVDESKAPNGQGDQKDVQKENDLETRVLALIAKNNNITMSQIADQLDVSYKTVQRFMDKLKEAGRVERKGGKRFGYWEIRSEPEK